MQASSSICAATQFKDARLRRAFNYAFDFEEMNKQLFYGQYKRINSYFEGTRARVVGTCRKGRNCKSSRRCATRCQPRSSRRPTTIRSAATRKRCATICARATRLLKEAGFEVRDRKLVDPARQAGQRRNPGAGPARRAHRAVSTSHRWSGIGVTTSIRVVDDAQYQNRLRSFDFDMIIDQWGQSLSPGNEQREFWGSQAADQPGSRNMVGIKNPAVDALIERVIFAKDRAGLVAATKAMDRVLLWNFYVVPQFTYGFSRYARWDRFSHAEPLPKYGRSGLPVAVVVRCRQGSQDRQAQLKESRMALLTRRHALGLGIGALSASRFRPAAADNGGTEMHGMSVFGDLKYPADFKHFDYVNPDAPKGGLFSHDPVDSRLQSVLPDVQFVQRLHPQGRRRQGHGADL